MHLLGIKPKKDKKNLLDLIKKDKIPKNTVKLKSFELVSINTMIH